MLGFAPEGVSRFLPYMCRPFKTGVARIAYETVHRNMSTNPDFSVKILPTGITFTHREKFRSDVLIMYQKPIVVDKTWMEGLSLTLTLILT
jgi:glycerol-3-phosphate O-acyltransferase/dihydroxyacetone phosphate acyltransferase